MYLYTLIDVIKMYLYKLIDSYKEVEISDTFSFQDFEDKIASSNNKEWGNIFELLAKYLLQSSNKRMIV